MDDLGSKSDDELSSIMQSAAANQYVPGSIYHRARIELERRTAKSQVEHSDLTTIAKSVLLAISKSKNKDPTGVTFISIEVLENQFGERHMPKVREALKELMERDLVEELKDYPNVFKITPFGAAYLSERHGGGNITYSNISHSNIAHQSSDVVQKLSIKDLSTDLQAKIKSLKSAAQKNNVQGMKSDFNIIADTNANVAGAIITGTLDM